MPIVVTSAQKPTDDASIARAVRSVNATQAAEISHGIEDDVIRLTFREDFDEVLTRL